jgi:hypothetical protein
MDMHIERITDSSCARSFIGSAEDRMIVGGDGGALVRPWRKKYGDAEPQDLTAPAKPSASSVRAAHADFVAALAGHPPRTIPLDADAIDLEDRAEHLSKIFFALSAYVAVILDDTAQNVPGGLDLRDAEGILDDLASDLTGTVQLAADCMAGRVA